jgi:hypothetical protein
MTMLEGSIGSGTIVIILTALLVVIGLIGLFHRERRRSHRQKQRGGDGSTNLQAGRDIKVRNSRRRTGGDRE